MTENAPNPPPPKPPPPDAGHMPMTEEMDSARWTLPSVVPLLVAAAAVALLAGGYYWLGKGEIVSTGAIQEVVAAEQPNQASVLVLVRVLVENKAEKPLWVRATRVTLKTSQGEWTDEAASAVDHDRYFQAYPELAARRGPPLRVEDRIPARASQEGVILVTFPVTKQAFDERQSLTVTIDPYDRGALVLRQ